MKHLKTTVGAIAALLVLAGCGAADETTNPVPDTSTSAATTSAPPPTAAPSTETSGPATASPTGLLSLAQSCQAVLDNQQGAAAALNSYVRNPLSGDVKVADLDQLRSELQAGELSAPEPLRQELNTQVGVLNRVVQGIQDRDVKAVDIGDFQDARDRITTLCAGDG